MLTRCEETKGGRAYRGMQKSIITSSSNYPSPICYAVFISNAPRYHKSAAHTVQHHRTIPVVLTPYYFFTSGVFACRINGVRLTIPLTCAADSLSLRSTNRELFLAPPPPPSEVCSHSRCPAGVNIVF